MPPAAPRLTPEPGIVVEAPKAVAGKFCDDDLLIFWNRHGDDSANGPLYAMAAIKSGFPDEAKQEPRRSGESPESHGRSPVGPMDGECDKERRLPQYHLLLLRNFADPAQIVVRARRSQSLDAVQSASRLSAGEECVQYHSVHRGLRFDQDLQCHSRTPPR